MFLFYAKEGGGEFFNLIDGEAQHCSKVLRKKAGDQLFFTDGKGAAFKGEIIATTKKKVTLKALENIVLEKFRPYRIHIAIAPTKNINRFEWFLEKATEIGIDEISPIICQRSERKVIKHDRSNRVLVSAMKQSLKTRLPILNELSSFTELIEHREWDGPGQKFIAHLEEDSKNILECYERGNDAHILIGPEGDFTPEEIRVAHDHGFKSVSLGDYRLRTETAGITAVQAVHFTNQLEK